MSFDARGNRIPTLGFKLNRLLWKFSPKLGLAFLNWKIDRMKVQMMIKLTGKTNHGRNRIREHGDLWEVLEVPTGVIKMSHKPPFPPIKSVKTGAERWLDDVNFSWIPERFQLTSPVSCVTICIVMMRKEVDMTYEEALALATKRMAPLGYFPWEIKDAALKMLGEECAKDLSLIHI